MKEIKLSTAMIEIAREIQKLTCGIEEDAANVDDSSTVSAAICLTELDKVREKLKKLKGKLSELSQTKLEMAF